MSQKIRIEKKQGGITLVYLDNPPFNLITLDMTASLIRLFSELETDDLTRVVVLSGSGNGVFCAGADIKEFEEVRDDVVNKKLKKENEAFLGIENLSKPVIAAIGGTALGGGCEIALACDIRIMSGDAKIGLPEIKLGVFPGTGGLYRLPKIVGVSKSLEMMYTGEPLTAQEAYRIGLVDYIVEREQVLAFALELAGKIVKKPRLALGAIKKGVRRSLEISQKDAILYTLELSGPVFKSADCEEGIKAFFEKRTPRFD